MVPSQASPVGSQHNAQGLSDGLAAHSSSVSTGALFRCICFNHTASVVETNLQAGRNPLWTDDGPALYSGKVPIGDRNAVSATLSSSVEGEIQSRRLGGSMAIDHHHAALSSPGRKLGCASIKGGAQPMISSSLPPTSELPIREPRSRASRRGVPIHPCGSVRFSRSWHSGNTSTQHLGGVRYIVCFNIAVP